MSHLAPRKMPYKMPHKLPDGSESSSSEAEDDETHAASRVADDGDPSEAEDDSQDDEVPASSKHITRKGSRQPNHFKGVRTSRMRKIGKRAAVRMCRKEVHGIMQGMLQNFVAGIMHDACAIEKLKTLSSGAVKYALERRNRLLLE